MHHSFFTQLWLCFCFALFTASCSNAEPTDPSLVGSWETTAVLDGRQWKFTYDITSSQDYRFASVTTDGYVAAHNGKWSLTSRRGFDDAGTYEFTGADSVSITGKQGTAIWTRVAEGNKPTGTKVDHLLIGTWRTEASIDEKKWSFTWVIKGIGRYRLTGITNDGSLIAQDGHWKSVSSSGKTEEGEYTFLNNGMAMSMTGPKGTGMWSRSGKTPYQEAVAKAKKIEKKPKLKSRPQEIIPLCTASKDEKGESGVKVETVAGLLKRLKFTTNNLPEGFSPPPDAPHVSTWRAPRKKDYNLCGRASYKLQGNKVRGYIYYLIHNTHNDALRRVEAVAGQGYDTTFVLEHLEYEKLGRYTKKDPQGGIISCVDRKEQRVGTPHRVLCVGLQPIYGVVLMLRGDFEQYDIDKNTAVHMLGKLVTSAKEVLAKTVQ